MNAKEKDKIDTKIFYEESDYKSVICFAENFRVCSIKNFNWFQKKMIKLFFGFEVVDYE